MMNYRFMPLVLLASALVLASSPAATAPGPRYLSPAALVAAPDGQTIYVACATASQVLVFDTASGKVTRKIPTADAPTGLALSADAARLFVTCAAPAGSLQVYESATGKLLKNIQVGHTPMSPVLSPDARTAFVCNRFNNDVSVLDLDAGKELRRIAVQREPVAAALTLDGKHLLVANLLHAGRADGERVAAVVSVIDVAAGRVSKDLQLPNGSGVLKDLRISPDGRYAVVSHLLGRFHLPTTQLDRGWMNTNAKTLIDLAQMKIINTVLLDDVDNGAANPWGIAWSADSKLICVALAGRHEVSVTDLPGLLAKLSRLPVSMPPGQAYDYNAASHVQSDVPNDLSFLVDVRHRVRLPESDRGPRALAVAGKKLYVANYFSDSLTAIDLDSLKSYPKIESFLLGEKLPLTQARKGELYFHDAGICFQGWQSCDSCHPGEARVDALNWDLLNDGIGNPKNNKSLLLVHKTPPAMSMAVRETAEGAVRAGIKHILFTVQPETVPAAIDDYLKTLQPVPSPLLVNGKLSPAARRGEKLFQDSQVGCAACHPAGLFTDLKPYDVGTRGEFDKAVDKFDTPTLIEVWRTAPYLHDGSAATMQDVLTTRNASDKHGRTSGLTSAQLEDLAAYILSL